MSNNRYNPIASAFRAAWSELSSDEAKVFYVRRSFEFLIRKTYQPKPRRAFRGRFTTLNNP
jgi:hypothetical protein